MYTMVKIVLTCMLSVLIFGSELSRLENDCLSCHRMQQIPNELIYRRYLMKYSTQENIENAMYAYLQNPQKINSIMPLQFFLKFPIKKPQTIEKKRVKENIKAYIKKFDVREKLILENK